MIETAGLTKFILSIKPYENEDKGDLIRFQVISYAFAQMIGTEKPKVKETIAYTEKASITDLK